MKQFGLESETVTKELPLISGKTPWGGMGDSHPRKPTGHWYDPMGREGLKVFHYNLPTDVRPGLETQQALTVDMGLMAVHDTRRF